MIERKELKPLRYVEGKININIDSIEDLSDEAVGNLLSRNIELLEDFITTIWDQSYSILDIVGSKPIKERKHIAFVKRVDLAKELARYCREELGIEADYTSGADSKDKFNEKKKKLASGELQFLFSCRKLTEGFDLKEVDAVWLLWPHSLTSEWMLKQEIGRGLRLDPDNLNSDCLTIDATYNSTRHNLSSVLGLFGQYSHYQGGLVSPGDQRKVELKILNFSKEGYPLAEIEKMLSKREREIAYETGWKFIPKKKNSAPEKSEEKENGDNEAILTKVEFYERKDIQRRMALSNTDIMIELAREMLAKNGYTDRDSLIKENLENFRSKDFAGKKGNAFYTQVVGKPTRNITKKELLILADIFFPSTKDKEQELEYFKELLFDNGYTDRYSLINGNPDNFRLQDFDGKKGRAFYALVTGKPTKDIVKENLLQLANIIFPVTEKQQQLEQLEYFKKLLSDNGYRDRESLVNGNPSLFKSQNFGGKKGQAFYVQVTGKSKLIVTKQKLLELADIIFPES